MVVAEEPGRSSGQGNNRTSVGESEHLDEWGIRALPLTQAEDPPFVGSQLRPPLVENSAVTRIVFYKRTVRAVKMRLGRTNIVLELGQLDHHG